MNCGRKTCALDSLFQGPAPHPAPPRSKTAMPRHIRNRVHRDMATGNLTMSRNSCSTAARDVFSETPMPPTRRNTSTRGRSPFKACELTLAGQTSELAMRTLLLKGVRGTSPDQLRPFVLLTGLALLSKQQRLTKALWHGKRSARADASSCHQL